MPANLTTFAGSNIRNGPTRMKGANNPVDFASG
jgi:hypothetical protein